MKLKGTGPKEPEGPNPFGALNRRGVQPVGPGVGLNRDQLVKGGPRRRRAAAHVLGETPPRDGPFATSAATIAVFLPPKARQRSAHRASQSKGGANPFRTFDETE